MDTTATESNHQFWGWLMAAPPEFLVGAIFGAGIIALGQRSAALRAKKKRDKA